jgi:hypothetical protein
MSALERDIENWKSNYNDQSLHPATRLDRGLKLLRFLSMMWYFILFTTMPCPNTSHRSEDPSVCPYSYLPSSIIATLLRPELYSYILYTQPQFNVPSPPHSRPHPSNLIYPSISIHGLFYVAIHLTLRPHLVQMLNDLEIRIQKPIHTILRTSLLVLLQLPASNRASNAFLPANVC